MLSQLNHWTETEKATLLAVSLRGAALTVLSNLTSERRGDYRALVIAMEKHFGADQFYRPVSVFPSSFSFSPFQYMMGHLYQIPVLHTKEGILTVGSICWNVSLHYWFYLSRTFNTIIFTVLLKFL